MNRVEEPHDLTPLQRKYLKNLWDYCRRPPTLARIYLKVLPAMLPFVFLMALLAFLCITLEQYEAAWIVVGMGVGVFLRDLGMFRKTLHLWPATLAVIDQEALADLVQEHHTDAESDEWS